MVQQREIGARWMLALTLLLGLGLAMGLTTMVSAGDSALKAGTEEVVVAMVGAEAGVGVDHSNVPVTYHPQSPRLATLVTWHPKMIDPDLTSQVALK